MRLKPLSRRTLLHGAGGIAIGLPFLEAMTPKLAHSQGATEPPKRIVFFQTPNGMQMDFWKCIVDPGDATQFNFSPILAPLAAHKDRLLILEGLAMGSSYDRQQQATAHQGGAASLWTGYWAGPGQMDGGGNLTSGYAISHSLDQELTRHPAVIGDAKFKAFYFGVLPSAHAVISRLFYAGKDQPIGPNADPYDVHRMIFSDALADQQQLARLTAERRTILDAALGDFRSIRCRLGSADRVVLDRHLTLVEEIEARLGRGGSTVGGNCQVLDLGAPINWYDPQLLQQLGRLQMDLMVAALSCDLTRVAALQWHSPVGAIIHSWLGHIETHHEITHRPEADANAQAQLREINTWYAGELRYLLDKMQGVIESNGKSLLENSVVIWTSEISTGWSHDRRNMPFVLAGGCRGHFRTGRYLSFPGENHNRLHLSLLAALGVDAQTFGSPDYCTGGALPNLT